MIVVTDNGAVEVDEPAVGRASVARNRFTFAWTGTDGVEWDLSTSSVGIVSGARGFGMPVPQHWLRQALGDGASYNGTRIPPRDVYMPVKIQSRSDLLELDRSFFAGMDPRGEGRLRVTTPRSSWREISCRYVEGAEGEFDMDPLLSGEVVYPLRLIAADPFWRGTPVVRTYRTYTDVAPRPTFPPAGSPLSLYFRRSDTLDGEGEITNPGDVETPAKWQIDAPFTAFDVGIAEQFVKMTLTKATGHVVIDTSGGMTRFYDETGANLRQYVDDFNSPPIPPGDTTLRLNVTNPGSTSAVTVSFSPPYFRAW